MKIQDSFELESFKKLLSSSYVSYNNGEEIKKAINEYQLNHYVPKHDSDDYLAFLARHDCSFTKIHPQSQNHPYYYNMFSVISQHVLGDTIEECFDKAMEYEEGKSRWTEVRETGDRRVLKAIYTTYKKDI